MPRINGNPEPELRRPAGVATLEEFIRHVVDHKPRRCQLAKLRALIDAAAAVKAAAATAPRDASPLERASRCVAAAPLTLKVRIGRNEPIPTVEALPRDKPWHGPADATARAVLEYAVGVGVDGGEGSRMLPELFEELLGYIDIPP